MKVDKFLEAWQEVLMDASEYELTDAIKAGEEEDFDNENYRILSGLLVEPDYINEKWRSPEHMPEELLDEVSSMDNISEYIRKYNLLDNNPYSDLWWKLVLIVDRNGY